MTEGFNIDLDADGFRKNHLDWRKFRDNYNRVSATKVERGIKPLPFSLLLKLFGSQKVFNTFVITRRNTNDIDTNLFPQVPNEKVPEMHQGEIAITNTLNFPGQGILNTSSEDKNETLAKGAKQLKRDALPVRPAFQRNIRVPGRYFPKPSQSVEDNLNLSITPFDSARERPRTQTPRSVHSSTYSFGGSTSHSGKGFRNLRIARGPVCKANDSFLSNPGRTQSWSGKSSAATIKSVPIDSDGFLSVRKTATANVSDHKADLYSNSFKSEENDVTFIANGNADVNGDIQSDLFTVKRPKHSARQVSFPKTSADFSAVLHGRPKTLHRRELTDSLDFVREPRARTHVGFADMNL
jgi:hypothetical protein